MKEFLRKKNPTMRYFNDCLESVSELFEEYLKVEKKEFNEKEFKIIHIKDGEVFVAELVDEKTNKSVISWRLESNGNNTLNVSFIPLFKKKVKTWKNILR